MRKDDMIETGALFHSYTKYWIFDNYGISLCDKIMLCLNLKPVYTTGIYIRLTGFSHQFRQKCESNEEKFFSAILFELKQFYRFCCIYVSLNQILFT